MIKFQLQHHLSDLSLIRTSNTTILKSEVKTDMTPEVFKELATTVAEIRKYIRKITRAMRIFKIIPILALLIICSYMLM